MCPIARRMLCFACLLTVACCLRAGAQEEADDADAPQAAAKLYEQLPFDEIVLKDGTSIRVEPIKLPDRRLPENPRSTDKLVVQLVDKPGEDFEIAWKDIDRVRLFELTVLEKGQELASQGNSALAYEYFDFLERRYPNTPGVKQAVERLIYQDAQNFARRREFDYVLVLLNQLHARNPDYPGLSRALGVATESLVASHMAAEQFLAARQQVQRLEQKYPNEPQVARLKQRLQSLAEQRLADARKHANSGDLRRAYDESLRALDAWPALSEARELAQSMFGQYPHVTVGVSQPLVALHPRIDDWAARRAARLLNLHLMEFVGIGAEGGNYLCPVGSFEKADLGLQLTFHLRPDMRWPDGSPLTGYDVSRTLLAMDDRGQLAADALWRPFVDRVEVRDLFSIDVRLTRAHVLPEALFDTRILPPAHLPPETSLGLFTLAERTEQECTYRPSQQGLGEQSPREIVERRYASARSALDGLRRHEVSIVDRINPWDVPAAREIANVTVASYAVPTVHCLLPNLNHPLLANRSFRRALMYGLHRESILQVQLLRGREVAAARVISGPFSTGYAYNNSVEIKPYDPRVAMMLMYVAVSEVAANPATAQHVAANSAPATDAEANLSTAPTEPDACPPLTLAHPASDVARLACRTIKRQLGMIRVPITLVELPPGETALPGGEYDLVYAALEVEEPLVDVQRLFGPAGLLPQSSAYLRAALQRAALATDWKSARDALLDLHRIVADEVTLLPLYQLPEHFAYRRNVQGLGEQPAALYQNVASWRVSPEIPSE